MDLSSKTNPNLIQSSDSSHSLAGMTSQDNLSALPNVSAPSGMTHAIFLTQQLQPNQPAQLSIRPNILVSGAATGGPNAIRINPNVRMLRMVPNVTPNVAVPNATANIHYAPISGGATMKTSVNSTNAILGPSVNSNVTVNVATPLRTTGCSILPKTSPNQTNNLVTPTLPTGGSIGTSSGLSSSGQSLTSGGARVMHHSTISATSTGSTIITNKLPHQRVVSPIKIAPSIHTIYPSSSAGGGNTTVGSTIGTGSGTATPRRMIITNNVAGGTSNVHSLPITSPATLRPKVPIASNVTLHQPPVSVSISSSQSHQIQHLTIPTVTNVNVNVTAVPNNINLMPSVPLLASSSLAVSVATTGSSTTTQSTHYLTVKRATQPKLVTAAASGTNTLVSLPVLFSQTGVPISGSSTSTAPRLIMSHLSSTTPNNQTIPPGAARHLTVLPPSSLTMASVQRPLHTIAAPITTMAGGSATALHLVPASGSVSQHHGPITNTTSPNRKRSRKQDIRTGSNVAPQPSASPALHVGVNAVSTPSTMTLATSGEGSGIVSVASNRNTNLFVSSIPGSTFYTLTTGQTPTLVPTSLINLSSASNAIQPTSTLVNSTNRQIYSFSSQVPNAIGNQLIFKPATSSSALQSFTSRPLQPNIGSLNNAILLTSGSGGTGSLVSPPNYPPAPAQTNVSAWLSTQNVETFIQNARHRTGANIAAQQGIGTSLHRQEHIESPKVTGLFPLTTTSRGGKRGRKPHLLNAGGRGMSLHGPGRSSPPRGGMTSCVVKGRRGSRQGSLSRGAMKRLMGESRPPISLETSMPIASSSQLIPPLSSIDNKCMTTTPQRYEYTPSPLQTSNYTEEFHLEPIKEEENGIVEEVREKSPSPVPSPVKMRRMMRLAPSKVKTENGEDSNQNDAPKNHFVTWSDFKVHESTLRKVDLPGMPDCMKYFDSLGRRLEQATVQLNNVTEDVEPNKKQLETLLEKVKQKGKEGSSDSKTNEVAIKMIADMINTIQLDCQILRNSHETIKNAAIQNHTNSRQQLEKVKARRSCRRSPRGTL